MNIVEKTAILFYQKSRLKESHLAIISRFDDSASASKSVAIMITLASSQIV